MQCLFYLRLHRNGFVQLKICLWGLFQFSFKLQSNVLLKTLNTLLSHTSCANCDLPLSASDWHLCLLPSRKINREHINSFTFTASPFCADGWVCLSSSFYDLWRHNVDQVRPKKTLNSCYSVHFIWCLQVYLWMDADEYLF